MKEKFKPKLILLECFALFFVINGINRFYVAYHGEKFDALIVNDSKKFESLTDMSVGELYAYYIYWTLATLLIGTLTIGLINWKNKIGKTNSIPVIIMTFGLSATGIYTTSIINRYLNYFCEIFGKGYGKSFLIGGFIILLIGIYILWKTLDKYKKHGTQHSV
ncbi:hypothetical protein [Mangrovimonas sp. YM274]|uniref:hypothetical protein n=1 Tax=Mangrovimonas sp. YM274 TaxID=3070660 RepID=UPI0027DAFE08|nr:hypothetical protein [Mangrovimonas sp. YM274]WMI68228.1 hypothetical protein RBH95_13890 [Mangrovimonas sp. YM274]